MIFYITQSIGWYYQNMCNIRGSLITNSEELKRRGEVVLTIKRKL